MIPHSLLELCVLHRCDNRDLQCRNLQHRMGISTQVVVHHRFLLQDEMRLIRNMDVRIETDFTGIGNYKEGLKDNGSLIWLICLYELLLGFVFVCVS